MRNFKEIESRILKDCGVTFDPFNTIDGHFAEPTKGYAVALSGYEVTVINCKGDTLIDRISKFVNDNAIVLQTNFLGLWVNGETLYIDIVKIIDDPYRAIIEGYRNNQKAIYDLNKNEEYILPGRQTAGTETQKSEYLKLVASRFERTTKQ